MNSVVAIGDDNPLARRAPQVGEEIQIWFEKAWLLGKVTKAPHESHGDRWLHVSVPDHYVTDMLATLDGWYWRWPAPGDLEQRKIIAREILRTLRHPLMMMSIPDRDRAMGLARVYEITAVELLEAAATGARHT